VAMARHRSFLIGLERAARAAVRAQREAEAEERRRRRDQLRRQRELLRLQQVNERLHQQQFVVSLQDSARTVTNNLAAQVDALRAIVRSAGHATQESIFVSLVIKEAPPVLTLSEALAQPVPQPLHDAYVRWVRPLGWWEKMFRHRSRYEREIAAAEERFQADCARWQDNENARVAQVAELERQHEVAFAEYQDKVALRKREINESSTSCFPPGSYATRYS